MKNKKTIFLIFLIITTSGFFLLLGVQNVYAVRSCSWYCLPGDNCIYRYVNCPGYSCVYCETVPTDCSELGCYGEKSSCFLPGTEVSTPDGSVNIEDIKPGNVVDSFEPMTEEVTTSTVASPYSVERDHYYVMTTESGNEVKVTDEHPFYVGEENTPKSLKDKIKNVFIMGIIYFKDGINIIKQSL